MSIYFDNAATSFPKPDVVNKAVYDFLVFNGGNAGRGASSASLKNSEIVYECREQICNFFNFNKTDNVIFTPNITYSLNILFQSVIKDGWHVITSSMEHNSVLRPLNMLKNQGKIELDIINCNTNGLIDLDSFRNCIKPTTKLVVLSHASNVIGTVQPLELIGKICKNNNIFFIIDSAQSAGSKYLNFNDLNCDALAFTGHKGLLGPQGIGGFIINDELNSIADPVFSGGTGSMSSSLLTPDYLPDKFECGTLNLPGIVGLNASLKFIKEIGLSSIDKKEHFLTQRALEILCNFKEVEVFGYNNPDQNRTSTISFNILNRDASEVSFKLDNQYNISTRTGLHCAPLAHRTIGTFPSGTVRISLGYFNMLSELDLFYNAIKNIIGGY